jgi:hypothetical protein
VLPIMPKFPTLTLVTDVGPIEIAVDPEVPIFNPAVDVIVGVVID